LSIVGDTGKRSHPRRVGRRYAVAAVVAGCALGVASGSSAAAKPDHGKLAGKPMPAAITQGKRSLPAAALPAAALPAASGHTQAPEPAGSGPSAHPAAPTSESGKGTGATGPGNASGKGADQASGTGTVSGKRTDTGSGAGTGSGKQAGRGDGPARNTGAGHHKAPHPGSHSEHDTSAVEGSKSAVAGKQPAGIKGQGSGSGTPKQSTTTALASALASVSNDSSKKAQATAQTKLPGATAGPVGTGSTSAGLASAPQAPTAVTLPASPAPPAVISPPAVTDARQQPPAAHHRARHHRQARGRVAGRQLLPIASTPARALPALAGTPVSVQRTAARRAPRSRARQPVPSRAPALVRTVTRIVGVVPLAVWILVGALLALALALAVRSRLSGLRNRRLEQQRGALLADVGLLQAALLPVPPARLGPVGTSAAYRPADGPGAGGDFYDVFALRDGHLAVIVGDVSGHGRTALPHTALVRFTLRAYLEAGLSPREALQTAGAVLEHQLGESFATVAAATYQPRERILTYACAGHPPPVVLGAGALAAVTACSAPPIGAGMRTGVRQTVVSLPGAASVCFYTDGLTEARVGSELFGADRLTSTLTALGPQPTAVALLDRVAEQTDRRPDDMAACLLSIAGDTAAPAVLVEQLELDEEGLDSGRPERFLLACGVAPGEVGPLLRSARAEARRAGAILLEVARAADGPPRVTLATDNVSSLYAAQARRTAARGVSL
jgi:serine phosphatase RsbU (regulator of sigma subunit)